jgi:nucleoid DNA-binding protein
MSIDIKRLSEVLALNLDIPKFKAQEAVYDLFQNILTQVQAGNKVFISDFGEFSLASRPSRKARNPKMGESVQVEAYSKLTFKPAKILRRIR